MQQTKALFDEVFKTYQKWHQAQQILVETDDQIQKERLLFEARQLEKHMQNLYDIHQIFIK